MSKKNDSYLVMESCEDYEQALCLRVGKGLPAGGVLDWAEGGEARAAFASRREALHAIARTEHYRLAFGLLGWPEKRSCKVVPIRCIAPDEVGR